MRYLLDTNTLCEPAKPSPDRRVVSLIQQRQFDIVTAATAWEEFLFGITSREPSQAGLRLAEYRDYLLAVELPVLAFDHVAAEWMGAERARLRKAGLTPAYRDLQIASVAACHGMTLVTRNIEDFTTFSGLLLQNWFAS